MTALKPFPADWQSMLVLMPHPDDPEYGGCTEIHVMQVSSRPSSA